MTTIITRLFTDQAAAQKAADRLMFQGVPKTALTIITPGDKAEAEMVRAKVHATASKAYASGLAAGNAVLVVAATYKPLGAVRLTRETLARYDTVDVASATQEHKLPWEPERASSVLKDHPLFLTVPGLAVSGPITGNFGMRMTKPHSAKRPLSDRRSSTAFWPMKLVSTKDRSSSVIRGGRHMSKMFWPMPLLTSRDRRKSVIPGGGFPLSRRLGLKTTT